MDKELTVYLHFNHKAEEKSWEKEFSRLLVMALTQVSGFTPLLESNLTVPGYTQNTSKRKDEVLQPEVIIVIFNEDNPDSDHSDDKLFHSLIGKIDKTKRDCIFVVRRYNRQTSVLPTILQAFPLYNLYELNLKTHEIIDFSVEHSDTRNEYLLKLIDLAYDIKDCIRVGETKQTDDLRNRSVYLAEVSADQITNREKLRRSLQLSGLRVLPRNSLVSSELYETSVKESLAKCILSVNILGESYGEAPPESDYSYQELQNRFFLDVWKQQVNDKSYPYPVKRIIWIPPQLDPFEEKQIQYLKRINREINNSENTELVQSTLSELKLLIEKKIDTMSRAPMANIPADTGEILVITDNYADAQIQTLKEVLLANKMQFQFFSELVKVNVFKQSEWIQILSKFHNYLVLNTQSDSEWIWSIISLLARSKGYENSTTSGKVGLFTHNPKARFENATVLSIEAISYTPGNLSDKLEYYISKLKS